MAKKTNKTVNKIDTVNIEIDYEKLAEAIVKAEKKASETKSYTANTFAALSGLIFRGAAWIGMIFTWLFGIAGVAYLVMLDWKNVNVFTVVSSAFLIATILLLIFLLSILLLKSAKEIEGEKDRQFVVAVFSAIVSFTALVVALLALFK